MTLEVVHEHEKLAPESGVEFRRMARIFGASFWSVCHGPERESRDGKAEVDVRLKYNQSNENIRNSVWSGTWRNK